MQTSKPWSHLARHAVWVAAILVLANAAGATTFKVIYKFRGGSDGSGSSPLVFDNAGNAYGETFDGGANGAGTIFKLTRSGGVLTKTVLYTFCSLANCPDGWGPERGLTIDKKGNLYGITLWGGDLSCQYGCGVVFGLSSANGVWTYKVLHSFNHADGFYPQASLTLDKKGNLFGTTSDASGDPGHFGTVFELNHSKNGWTKTVLHAFTDTDGDGAIPFAPVILDRAGNLYGTTAYGGTYFDGTVYELSPSDHGWTEKVLHSFSNDRVDGQSPLSGVTLDAAGNLYGSTYIGGDFSGQNCQSGCGTIYQLTASGGSWTETILYQFTDGADGAFPGSELIVDRNGTIYGTATNGGHPSCDEGYGCGVVFKLTPSNGTWAETVLHSFTGNNDGWAPGRLVNYKGVLLGASSQASPYNAGDLFVLKP